MTSDPFPGRCPRCGNVDCPGEDCHSAIADLRDALIGAAHRLLMMGARWLGLVR